MKMLGIHKFLYLSFLLLLIVACSETEGPQTYEKSLEVKADGGSFEIKCYELTSSVSEINKIESWINVRGENSANSLILFVTVDVNNELESRSCIVNIACDSGDKLILRVSQEGYLDNINNLNEEKTDNPAL